jgi:SAM-dependent methyltransferase
MVEDHYVHSDEQDAVERNRLTIQASILDPITIRHLKTIGVTEGWNCLDVGAGAGSIAQWLATQVGSTGHVVATDIDIRFLKDLNTPNLEVRQHDILTDDLEKNSFDLVHCRLLLMHLSEPETALKRMAEAVRPGGWLLIEEQDYGSTLSLDVTDQSTKASTWVEGVRAMMDFLLKRGFGDGFFGRRVRALIERLGFVDVDQDGWTRISRGGDDIARERAAAWQTAMNLRMSAGDITQEEAMRVIRLFSDPTFSYLEYTIFSAWGRKPIQDAHIHTSGTPIRDISG